MAIYILADVLAPFYEGILTNICTDKFSKII